MRALIFEHFHCVVACRQRICVNLLSYCIKSKLETADLSRTLASARILFVSFHIFAQYTIRIFYVI